MLAYGDPISVGNDVQVFEPGGDGTPQAASITVMAAASFSATITVGGTVVTCYFADMCDSTWRASTVAIGSSPSHEGYFWTRGAESPPPSPP